METLTKNDDQVNHGVARTSIYVAAFRMIATNRYYREISKNGSEEERNAIKEYQPFFDETLVDNKVPPLCKIYDPYAYFFCTTPEAKELAVQSIQLLSSTMPGLFEHPIVKSKLADAGMAHITTPAELISSFQGRSPAFPWNFMGTPGTADRIYIRTKYIDDVIMENQKSIKQIVLLGAGMDTRALRLPLDQETTVFELDTPLVIKYKTGMLQSVSKHITPRSKARNVHVAADLRFAEQWTKQLVQCGFDPNKPSFWLAEGLLMYLNDEEIDVLLQTVSSLSCGGSRILAQTVDPIPPADTPERKMLYLMSAPISEFRSFSSTPNVYLEKAGFSTEIDIKNYVHLDQLYGTTKQLGPSSSFTLGTKPILSSL